MEDRLTVLDGDHAAGAERATVSDSLDLVQDGDGGVAGAQEVGVERVRRAGFDRAVCRDQRLACHLAAEDPLAAFVGALTAKDVPLDRFEVQEVDEVVDDGLSHPAIVAIRGAKRVSAREEGASAPACSGYSRLVQRDDQANAEAARGFMPPDEGVALWRAASASDSSLGPLLEVGSYCGKSALYLGPVARDSDSLLFCVDHHRGSEENQAGWEWHEPDLVDAAVGRIDTLPAFRRTVHDAGLEPWVIAVVGDGSRVVRYWTRPLRFLFIDGGHGVEPAGLDFELWTPFVAPGGLLAIHDVFPDPADGGRPPYEQIYLPALASGRFVEQSATGSLRVLRCIG